MLPRGMSDLCKLIALADSPDMELLIIWRRLFYTTLPSLRLVLDVFEVLNWVFGSNLGALMK